MLISGHTVGQQVRKLEVEKAKDQIRKIEMHTNRRRYVEVWLLLIAGLLMSCSPKSTPPGANSIGGSVDGARFSYHYWEEGLAILIWHDLSYGGEGCSGTGSTEDPVYELECDAESTDGQTFSWKVHSRDGVTGEMWIDDQRYDLSQGNMFLVSSQDNGVQVDQLQRDFSELEPNAETISALSNSDPDVADFIARIGTESDSPEADNKDGLAAFIDGLQLADQSVEIAGAVEQPFFSVPGQIIVVNGEDVQVFEYPDSTDAEVEAAQISPDASSVGTSMASWVGTPHFYTQDYLIVLYVGENDSVKSALVDVLGEPIAEGQGANLPPQDDSTAEPVQGTENIVSILPEALTNQDYVAVEEMMGEPFIIGYWLSEGLALSPAEAVKQLQTNLLADPSKATFTADPGQLPDLGPFDPWRHFGPDATITNLIFSRGWGMDGSAEAILAIAQSPEGNQYWHGVIFAGGGFTEIPGPTFEESSSSPTVAPELETPTLMHPLAGLLYRDGQEIWIIDEKGEPLFVFDEPSARLSADGRFVLYQPEYDPDIWLADLTTGERRNLTVSSDRYNGLAQWWPGQPDIIIFGSSEELGPGFGYPTTVHTDGSDYHLLDQERGGPLALSADGELLAYGGFDEPGRIVRRGSEPEDFYPADYGLDVEKVFQPAWSADGRKLAWKVSGNLERQGWTSGVAVFDLAKKSAELFHTYEAVGGGSVPHYLSWSPNGDWLAFVTFNERAEDGRRPNLWISHPDGQGEVRLGTSFESAWSPDGSQLAFTSVDDTQEASQVWIHDTLTGEQTQILPAGTTTVDWLEPTNELMQTLRQYSTAQ